jgi:hypothetical protein
VQAAIAPIRDGKHYKNEDEGANELDWGDEIWDFVKCRGPLKTKAGSHFIKKAIG